MSVLLLLAIASSAASCPTEPRTTAGVESAEQRWVAALEHRDTRALDCILDPAFADTSWRGELIPKAPVLGSLPNRPASTLELSALQPTLVGDVAIMRGINTQYRGGKVVGSVRFIDVFVYRSVRWQAISAQESFIATSP